MTVNWRGGDQGSVKTTQTLNGTRITAGVEDVSASDVTKYLVEYSTPPCRPIASLYRREH